jgi:hypothetical protein
VLFAGNFFRCSVGDSNGTGRNLRSTVGDCGADFGVQTGGGGESDFLMPSIESSDLLHSDQMPVETRENRDSSLKTPMNN